MKLKPVDLTKTLASYKSGWVAVDRHHKVVAHAKTYAGVSKKVQHSKDVFLVPASSNYFGFITTIRNNG